MGRREMSNRPGRWRREGQFAPQTNQPRPRLTPEEVRAGASTKITRLQAALQSLGPNDHAERSSLEASLKKAQQQATIPPVAQQAEQTAQFIERAKKRLSSAEEWVQWAQDWRSECAKELHDAELRLARIRAEVAEVVEDPSAPPDWEAEARRLRQQVAELQCQRPLYSRVQASHPIQSSVEAAQLVEERASKRRDCGEEVPSTEQAIAEWMCSKHLELRDALEIGDPSVVVELSQLLATGASKMQTLSGAVSMVANSAR